MSHSPQDDSSSLPPQFGGQALPDVAAHYREYLLRSEQLRAVRDGIAEGLSVEAVADSVGMSVETVTEMAESLDRGADADVSPYELIVRAFVEGASRRELVDRLSAFEYTENPSILPWPMQGAVFGTWRAVERASQVQGLLSPEELEEVRSRRGPLTQELPIDWNRGRRK
ncbi:hypothetical protein [Arthrobacter sp. PAMC 25486]|uniref:hypothetical protein n=1 Tax=Arthrobacter sp. PAMC 25486 TaxID=1494608 RepID=UPI000571A29A|nr:hypothetical protein [Arthrobacter sp. PAMC 25486]